MQGKRGRVGRVVGCTLTFVLVVLAWSSAPGPVIKTRKMVGLEVTAMRGTRRGEEQDDADLDEIGKKLKKKLKLKRLEVIDRTNFAANSGIEITTGLGDDMKIKMRWRAMQKDVARFKITVLRGKTTLLQKEVAMKVNEPAVAISKLGKDVLILLMKSQVEDDD